MKVRPASTHPRGHVCRDHRVRIALTVVVGDTRSTECHSNHSPHIGH